MYAILLWKGASDKATPLIDENLQLDTFDTLEEADKVAFSVEEKFPEIQCRVISIDSVHE